MKSLKQLKTWILKTSKLVWEFIQDTGYMFAGIWILFFHKIRKPAIFRGHFAFKLAQRYGVKRHKGWKPAWDQLGRQQGILPFGDYSLLVCSPMEMKYYQKRGLLKTEKNYKKYFKANYWQTAKTLNQYNIKTGTK